MDKLLRLFSGKEQALVKEKVLTRSFTGVISADTVKELLELSDQPDTTDVLLQKFLTLASYYALTPVSGFRVGAISEGKSGELYLGANLEIEGAALAFSVHAEQSAINNALLHGEKGIKRIVVSAAPCGHCRQFLNELSDANKLLDAEELEILMPGKKSIPLRHLLRDSFGPADLGIKNALFGNKNPVLIFDELNDEPAICSAMHKLQSYSYAPYTGSLSSVSLKVNDEFTSGVYIENAAFNPSLPPVLSALDRLRFVEKNFNAITEAVLLELKDAKISQAEYTRALLNIVSPNSQFKITNIRRK